MNSHKITNLLLFIVTAVIVFGVVLTIKNKRNETLPENKPIPVDQQNEQGDKTTEDSRSAQQTVARKRYSFEVPKHWLVGIERDFEGCTWDGISMPSDGHELKGEIGIYPASCFDIAKSNATKHVEKDGYYITATYDKDGTYANEVEAAYSNVVNTFVLK